MTNDANRSAVASHEGAPAGSGIGGSLIGGLLVAAFAFGPSALSAGGNGVPGQEWACERLALDLPAEVRWQVQVDEEEGEVARRYQSVPDEGGDYLVDEVEVSAVDRRVFPYKAAEFPQIIHRLTSAYDPDSRLTVLREGREAGGYWALYRISGGSVSRSTMLGVVRETREGIHTATMELVGEVGEDHVLRWSRLLADSRVIPCGI